jgi:nucleoside-diphosphate-sugar epimerase
VRLAELAKQARVPRFLFASSCSVYGASRDVVFNEASPLAPLTPYAESKALVEKNLGLLADDDFSPTYLRNATAYGISPRLRLDLAPNECVASAVAAGRIIIRGDSTAWRPLIHIEDVCRAFEAVLAAPRKTVHHRAFNVGRTEENYRLSEMADLVCRMVPDCRVEYQPSSGLDKRCYQVDCNRLAEEVPGFRPRWTLADGVRQLCDAFRSAGLTSADLDGDQFDRSRALRAHLAAKRLTADLRWRPDIAAADLGALPETQRSRPTFRATYTSSCSGPASSGVRL